MSQEIMM